MSCALSSSSQGLCPSLPAASFTWKDAKTPKSDPSKNPHRDPHKCFASAHVPRPYHRLLSWGDAHIHILGCSHPRLTIPPRPCLIPGGNGCVGTDHCPDDLAHGCLDLIKSHRIIHLAHQRAQQQDPRDGLRENEFQSISPWGLGVFRHAPAVRKWSGDWD